MDTRDDDDYLELVRPDVGLRFAWDRASGVVDAVPLPDSEVSIYESIDVTDVDTAEHFTDDVLAVIVDTWIAEHRELLA